MHVNSDWSHQRSTMQNQPKHAKKLAACVAVCGMRCAATERGVNATEWSPPRVDRHGLAILRAHDAPVAVGLAADHDDVDVLLRKDADRLVLAGFQPGRHRLLPECRPRID